jgi:pantoate--beta-alanine ligase
VALSRALRAAEDAVSGGERDAAEIVSRARAALAEHGVEPEYLELVSTETLAPVDRVGDADVLVAVAARVGLARLIDNTILLAARRSQGVQHQGGGSPMQRTMLKSKIHGQR